MAKSNVKGNKNTKGKGRGLYFISIVCAVIV